MRRWCLVLLFVLLPVSSWAWNDEGHMLVARIAWSRLQPKVRTTVTRLLTVNSRRESADFVTAACWADDLKRRGDHSYDAFHYVDLPFSPDKTPFPTSLERENVLVGLNRSVRTLKDPRAEAADKADMLRLLIHFVGDIHQPLHCVSRYTRAHPTGDRGGNDFRVQAGRARNLHSLWDSGVGLFPQPPDRPLEAQGTSVIATTAASITKEYPAGRLAGWRQPSFRQWAQEGKQTAEEVVYATPEGLAPSADYVSRSQKVVRMRLALAGYRLADLLNRLYAPKAAAPRARVR